MIFMSKIKNLLKTKIFWIFVFSFLIREYFVFNNYPFIFHPDEPTIINSTINLRYNLNPKHFDWPTTYYYLNYPIYNLYERFVSFSNNRLGIPITIKEIDYYLVSRTLTALLGSLNVVFVYLILRNLNKDKYSCETGAVIFSLFTFLISRSALALIDIPMLLFCSISIYFLTKNLLADRNLNYYLSCFFAGLAVSTKYNGYMVFLTIFLYFVLVRKISYKDVYLYLYSGLISVLGFFIGTPYFLFDAKTFFDSSGPKGAMWQFTNVGKVTIDKQFFSFFENLFNSLDLVVYLPLVVAIFYIFYFIFKIIQNKKYRNLDNYDKVALIFIIQFLFVYWSVSGVSMQRSQYLVLAFLFLPIFWVSFFEKFLKIHLISLFLYLIISGYMLFNLIEERPIVYFYRNVSFSAPLIKYTFLYTDPDHKKILNKLDVNSDRFTGSSTRFKSIYTHLLSSTDMCSQKNDECNLKLIKLIESKSREDKLYIYEIKR